MKAFDRVKAAVSVLVSPETRSMSFQDVFGRAVDLYGAATKSGEAVSHRSSLQLTTVWACIRILSDGVSTLPIATYTGEGNDRTDYPEPDWLRFDVGPYRKIDFMVQAMTSLLLDGNAYIAVWRGPNGVISYLEVIDPNMVSVTRIPGQALFEYRINGFLMQHGDILHIRGMTLPYEEHGLSPIRYHRETIGLNLAATKYGAAFFGNSAIPAAAMEVPGTLSDVAIKQLTKTWNEVHQGSGNAHRLAVATEGAKFVKISISPEEAQFLETRKFGVGDIARIFGVAPHMLADASGSTSWGSGLAEQDTGFAKHTLRPWTKRIEEVLTWLMHMEGEDPTSYAVLNLAEMLQGDPVRQMELGVSATVNGIMTINEFRGQLNLPKVEWGDEPISVQTQAPVPDEYEDPPKAPEANVTDGGERSLQAFTVGMQAAMLMVEQRYRADQPRDAIGRWGGGSGKGSPAGMVAAIENTGGFTTRVSQDGVRTPIRGVSVATSGHTRMITGETWATSTRRERIAIVEEYLADNHDIETADPKLHFGGWKNGEDGSVWLDLPEVFKDPAEAEAAGSARGEIAGYNLGTGEEIPFGGTGDITDQRALWPAQLHDSHRQGLVTGGASGIGREAGGRSGWPERRYRADQPRAADGKWGGGGSGVKLDADIGTATRADCVGILQGMGIGVVDFGDLPFLPSGDPGGAREVTQAMRELHDKGYKMPDAVVSSNATTASDLPHWREVQGLFDTTPLVAATVPDKAGSSYVVIRGTSLRDNTTTTPFDTGDADPGWSIAQHSIHATTIHEMGHVQHAVSGMHSPSMNDTRTAMGKAFPSSREGIVNVADVKRIVSPYAATNGKELVAEVFTARHAGRAAYESQRPDGDWDAVSSLYDELFTGRLPFEPGGS